MCLAVTVVSVAMSGIGRADPKTGSFEFEFACNFDKLHPSVNPGPTKSNCLGWANGSLAAVLGKSGSYSFVGDAGSKPNYVNFMAYDINWTDTCAFNGDPSISGQATGDLTVQGSNTLTGAQMYLHSQFDLFRVGATWSMTLIDPHAHNGQAVKGHSASKSGGSGEAGGSFAIKNLPAGVCGAPVTPQTVQLDGNASGTIN
jgi:hypothetical protein